MLIQCYGLVLFTSTMNKVSFHITFNSFQCIRSDHKTSMNNLAQLHIIWPFLDWLERTTTALLTPKLLHTN